MSLSAPVGLIIYYKKEFYQDQEISSVKSFLRSHYLASNILVLVAHKIASLSRSVNKYEFHNHTEISKNHGISRGQGFMGEILVPLVLFPSSKFV